MARSNSANAADHLHHHSPRCHGGVDLFGQRPESASALALTRSRMFSTSFSDRDMRSSFQTTRVSPSSKLVEHLVQFWSVPASTRRRFLEDTAASGGLSRPGLQGVGLLIAFGYASITKQ